MPTAAPTRPNSLADSAIDAALDSIRSKEATASRAADLAAIRKLIESKPGGFDQLDATVKHRLHQWFENHGAVRSADRIERGGSATAARGASSPNDSATMSIAEILQVAGSSGAAADPPHFTAGARCAVTGRGTGTVRFVGDIPGHGVRVGVELDGATGMNSGSAFGVRYFECAEGHGVFVRPHTVAALPDDDGKDYIDCDAGDATTIFGFGD